MSFKDIFQTITVTANGTEIRYTWEQDHRLPKVYREGLYYKFNKKLINVKVTLPHRKENNASISAAD